MGNTELWRLNKKKLRYFMIVFCASWRLIISLLLPIILLPLVLMSHRKEAKAAYVCIIMAVYWMLELLPLPVTALMPVLMLPLFGIVDTDTISRLYMKGAVMLLVGGLILAVAVEHCNLHKRIALKVLIFVGKGVHWLMLGFMITTMFLSMWISNTATTAMMVPIADAVIEQLSEKKADNDRPITVRDINAEGQEKESKREFTEMVSSENFRKESPEFARMRFALLLSIAYSANCGGTGSLTGTGPNLVFKGLMEREYPTSNDVTFATWMIYNVPGMIICVLLAWVYLAFVIMKYKKDSDSDKATIRNTIKKEYDKLGILTFQEGAVFTLFFILVLLWIFRDPKFIPGWIAGFDNTVHIDDATPAIGIALLLFLIPAKPLELRKSPPLLDWKTAQRKVPWGVVLLIGGGFALAEGAKTSQLSLWIGQQLTVLEILSVEGIIILLCIITEMLTEVFSNAATANILLPVLNELAIALKVNPLYFLLPVTISCSYAFMLPVATPPNAIVFDAGKMKIRQMIIPGLVMNVICCLVQFAMITTLGKVVFNLGTFPNWASSANTTTVL